MKKYLFLLLLALPLRCFGGTGDISAITIEGTSCAAAVDSVSTTNQCEGGVADITLTSMGTGGSYAFGLGTNNATTATSKVRFTVTGTGYNSAGSGTTPSRTVYGVYWMRQPSPNNLSADETTNSGNAIVRVVLNDYIYSGETVVPNIAGGFYTKTAVPNNACSACVTVTNSSNLAYPSALPRFATAPYQRITGAFTVEVAAFDKFGISSVVISCADAHSHTVYKTVTYPTPSNTGGLLTPTGLAIGVTPGMDMTAVSVYQANFTAADAATFMQADPVSCDFTVYPVVATTSPHGLVATAGNGNTMPTEKLATLPLLNDTAGTYGAPAAAIDPANGRSYSAGSGGDCTGANTCMVYSTLTLAKAAYVTSTANSYKTIGDAVQACTKYNVHYNSHTNPDGCIAYLETASNSYPGVSPGADQGVMKTWFQIQCGPSGVLSAGTIASLNTRLVEVTGCPLTASSVALMYSGNATDSAWIDNNTINFSGTALLYVFQVDYATRNSIINAGADGLGFASTRMVYGLVRGNSSPSTSSGVGTLASLYAIMGNKNINPSYVPTGNLAGTSTSDGYIYADNELLNYAQTSGSVKFYDTGGVCATGGAIVQNLIEGINTGILLEPWDQSNFNCPNTIMWHNTTVGGRLDNAYNFAGSTPYYFQNWSEIGNWWINYNYNGDTISPLNSACTGSTSCRTGNILWDYNIGNAYNQYRATSGATPPAFWGVFTGVGNLLNGTTSFVADASGNEANGGGDSGTGNGNYHLKSNASAVHLMPYCVIPYDLDGRVRNCSGWGSVSVYEQAVILTPVFGW